MKKEYEINDIWLGYEIHPETPAQGVLLNQHLPHIDWQELYQDLRESGSRFGIEFGQVTCLANSGMALVAAEFARHHGKFEHFHELLFQAYFTETRDIGSLEVITDLAAVAGLDPGELKQALAEQRYRPQLDTAAGQAHSIGITSVPSFLLPGNKLIVGAKPLDVFRQELSSIGKFPAES